jgi:hypothetical protein
MDTILLLFRAYNALETPLLNATVQKTCETYKRLLRSNRAELEQFEGTPVWAVLGNVVNDVAG